MASAEHMGRMEGLLSAPPPPKRDPLSWVGYQAVRLFHWIFNYARPVSYIRAKRSTKLVSVSRLYVLYVDHPVSKEQAEKMDVAFDSLRKKYDIDFVVLEPGMRLSRFEDI